MNFSYGSSVEFIVSMFNYIIVLVMKTLYTKFKH